MSPDSPFFFSHHPPLQEAFESACNTYDQTGLLVVTGASGTGKTHVCRKIHSVSCRKDNPFVSHSAASFDEGRFESQLYGHVKGAFSGAVKNHPGLLGITREGSLCIEDLASLSTSNQARLLRFIQERTFRRVGSTQNVAFHGGIMFTATQPLQQLLTENTLRDDFFYRIGAVEVALWDLRDRPLDFDDIAATLVDQIRQSVPVIHREPDDHDLDCLKSQQFPGNIHGLRNALMRSMISGMPPEELGDSKPLTQQFDLPNLGSLKSDLLACEKQLLQRALKSFPYSRSNLAKHLGISRRSLHYKLKQHDLGKP